MSSLPPLYKTLVPLNRDRHRKLKLRADRRWTFASSLHFGPIVAVEFYDVARDYPIVFSGGENPGPVAMLGLRTDENLFVDADGQWADGAYVPAFFRRYPFILVRPDQATDYTVCVDESYDGLSEEDGTPLFDEEGKESEHLSGAVRLLGDLMTEAERTRRFVERLTALELLMPQSTQVQDRVGRRYALHDFRIVDEKKLATLDNDVLGELHRSGYLGCIYAHLVSLGNVARLAARVPADEPAAGTTATTGAA